MKKSNIQSEITITEGITKINTPDGIGNFEGVKVTETGNIMAKVFFPQTKQFVKYKIGSIHDLLGKSDLSFV